MEQGEIILYQPNETVWLTKVQMAELFDIKENIIT